MWLSFMTVGVPGQDQGLCVEVVMGLGVGWGGWKGLELDRDWG